jgi:hypothetical protein
MRDIDQPDLQLARAYNNPANQTLTNAGSSKNKHSTTLYISTRIPTLLAKISIPVPSSRYGSNQSMTKSTPNHEMGSSTHTSDAATREKEEGDAAGTYKSASLEALCLAHHDDRQGAAAAGG